MLLYFRYRGEVAGDIRTFWPNQQPVALPGLQVFAFGVTSLVVNGQYQLLNLRGRMRKMPEFLLYLILEGRHKDGCRWTELGEAMWPEETPDKLSHNFHQTLRRLRELLGAHDCIMVQGDYYRVNDAYLNWCDAVAFETLARRITTAAPEHVLDLQLELIETRA